MCISAATSSQSNTSSVSDHLFTLQTESGTRPNMKNDIMVADIFIVTATVSKHQRLDFRAFSASSIFQGVEERLFQCWSNQANLKLHSRSKFYDSHTFYKWLILEFREITISNPGEKCKICLGLGSPRSSSPHVDGTVDISRKWWRARSAKDAEMIYDLGAPSFGIEVTFLVVNHSGRQVLCSHVLCFLAAPVVLCLHCRFIHSLLWIQSIPDQIQDF